MPNLNQIYNLKNKYYKLTSTELNTKEFIEKSEARDLIEKAFDSRSLNENIRETRMFSFINESLQVTPDIIEYFNNSVEEEVALLFIDITSFSKTIRHYSNVKIKEFLDDYYENLIPIIYKHGGEIEKLMGDGVICVFGRPFLELDKPEYIYKAEKCAEEVIKKFHGSDKNVKVAIHQGKINYYKVPGDHYGEYTMIGQPMTDLFRLESVSKPNAINFYDQASYDLLGWRYSIFDVKDIHFSVVDVNSLQGVEYSKIKAIKFPDFL